ncbi:hypothetical protein K7I13_02330 [Brucepastera parasyntrophica]|uniref:hypothetical protein n=1 Tax=Brucepastera parasyntrophica TaxID=2880008 RepID=UPI00210A4C4D|nr:hypothetical protein [Brucepastera parasyntrophica]ULQ60177.1 hypothetical protein K7I13_02330 [Brucepastera parasyntrophica]
MINTWNESFLHEELKNHYCRDNTKQEVAVEGSICDAVASDGTLIEIQTANIGKLKPKLLKLLDNHPIRIVYPIAVNLFLETYSSDLKPVSRRKSPKHGSALQIFRELTGIYDLVGHRNLSIEIVFADILEMRMKEEDRRKSWKGFKRENKKLLHIHDSVCFTGIEDYCSLIPQGLPELFTVSDLAAAGAGRHAGIMAWVLRKWGVIEQSGKQGRAYLYRKI